MSTEERILAIVPCYNERSTLPDVVAGLLAVDPRIDVLVIDDGSPDGTGHLADRLAEADPRVSVVHREEKLGLGSAYVLGHGLALSGGYAVSVQIDGDGSHRPEELAALLHAIGDGAGLAIGTRWMPRGRIIGWPRYRRLISRAGTLVARLCLRSRLRDITSGFRAVDTDWLARLDLAAVESQGYSFQVETAWRLERAGCPIAEVPITFVERRGGVSKMSVGIIWEALRRVVGWGAALRLGRGADTTKPARETPGRASHQSVSPRSTR